MSELTRRAFPLTAAACWAWAADAAERRNSKTVRVASSEVRLTAIEESHGPTYFHPHENEHASAAVTRAVVREHGGRLLEIQSRGTRLISFTLNGAGYSFDPNRMFTDEGLRRNLAHYGRYSPAARDAIKPLRNAVLSYLKRAGGAIVGVDNNAVNGLNLGSYLDGAQFARDALRVAANPRAQKHNFFLVQDEKLFAALERAGFNVVLQTSEPTDDGSLSVYCRQNGWRYVNVQAGEDQTDEQRQMLEGLRRLLK
jgi:hypothetical protein